MMRSGLVWLVCAVVGFAAPSGAEPIKGIYGVPAVGRADPKTYVSRLKEAGVNTVFVPAEKETIRWFKTRGFQVYVSVNAFGGKGAWKRYPDSRPIKADGTPFGSERGYKGHGGVCPTHQGWREGRLEHIRKLVKQLGDEGGINGIWLDFIRYPGLWESKDPRIPDTCYCPRCLKTFERDSGIQIPGGLTVTDTALWIKKNCPYRWMTWKKGQIASFVREVRAILQTATHRESPLKLGLFLVPWSKGERQNAISYLLAQDAFQLSRVADVISPMVYHKMCGKPASWVGYMTGYYKETARCQVWPIIQVNDCEPQEIAKGMRYAGQAGADGVLAFSFRGIRPGGWGLFKGFERPCNLIPNPEFKVQQGDKLPAGWHTKRMEGRGQEAAGQARRDRDVPMDRTAFLVKPSEEFETRGDALWPDPNALCLGISAGSSGEAAWYSRLEGCVPGEEYVFTGRFFRDRWRNGEYPSIGLWGRRFYLNTHWLTKTFQPLRVYVTCPEKASDPTFRFINPNRGETFWLSRPRLERNYPLKQEVGSTETRPFFSKDFFPIGVYGVGLEDLEQVKRLAINTVLIGGDGEELKRMVLMCHHVGLRYVLRPPWDPERLPVFLNDIASYVRPYDLAFYVNDEPGIHSFPVNTATDINRLIKERFPESATAMAVVRPQVCRDYVDAADFFMMDQYPVPYMPMTWLSDSMDQCAKGMTQGTKRIASVIQAFGGRRWANVGWPRLPTWQEINCLAFLSVVHGSRGVFFFTFNVIGKTQEGRDRLGRVVGRLNRVYPWLVTENLDRGIEVEMVSPYRFDPKGRPAVHCCLKKKGDELLLIAVNTIGTYVEARVGVEVTGCSLLVNRGKGVVKGAEDESRITNHQITNNSAKQMAREVFSGEDYVTRGAKLRARFGPYEVKAFLFREN